VTTSAQALADPVGTVVSLVTAADPVLERDLVRRIVEQVGGGRSKRRRLAVELAGNPSVLTTGRSPASKAAGDLMIALRAAGATGISPPWCADCGHRVTSVQRRGEHWYCAPCYVRPEDCAGCGNTRQVAFRDRQGRPRCSKCPDQDACDPLLALVEIITATDPGLPAEAAAAAIEATVTKQAHLQRLAWLLHDKPELLTGDGAKAPFPVVLRLIDALCEAGATRIRRPACPRCRRVIALGKQRDGLRICRSCCARARAVPCAKCGTTSEPAARDGQGRPLCSYCLVSDPVNLEECVRCRRRRQVSTRTPAGPVCATCNPRGILACSSCGRTAPCAVSKITGQPRCGACARSLAQCSRCGQLATARAGTRDAPLCGNCAVPGPGLLKTCPGCGSPGRLIAGACRRCHLRQRLDELLADSAGNVRPELQVLHQTLATTDRPAAVLAWLSGCTPQAMLTELAAGLRPLTHAALDELPASKPLTHLRSVLVATGALPARDEHLIELERWITQAVAGRADRQEKEIVHRYAVWHVLRRLRQRIRGTHATSGQADVARRNIAAAAAFLDWLTARGLTLASCPQGDLDEWTAAATASQRGPAGHFIRWARNQKLTSLDFPATRWAGPTRVIDAEGRWAQARRLLHDGTLKPEDRAAGLLVLLYAQQPATISRLTLGHVQPSDGEVRLRLGREPVVLPEPLAGLILHLAAARQGHATTGDRGTSPWLLPGGRPGQPISPYRLSERLRQIGIQPGPARSTALFQLATELPAAILARMLGIHIDVAVAWQRISAGDWMTYAADVSRRESQPGAVPSRHETPART
jgi:hypothetical protein